LLLVSGHPRQLTAGADECLSRGGGGTRELDEQERVVVLGVKQTLPVQQ